MKFIKTLSLFLLPLTFASNPRVSVATEATIQKELAENKAEYDPIITDEKTRDIYFTLGGARYQFHIVYKEGPVSDVYGNPPIDKIIPDLRDSKNVINMRIIIPQRKGKKFIGNFYIDFSGFKPIPNCDLAKLFYQLSQFKQKIVGLLKTDAVFVRARYQEIVQKLFKDTVDQAECDKMQIR